MNSNNIRLSGKFEIPEPILIDHDYQFNFTGGVTSVAKTSNDDGSYEYTYNIKPIHGEIINDKGETIRVVKKGSQSQRLRAMILAQGLDYPETMNKIMDNLDSILEKIR